MLTEDATLVAEAPQLDGQDDSVKQVLSRLYADGRAYAEAEIEKQKLRAGLVTTGVRNAAILAVLGGALAFASLIALLVGVVLTLAPLIGAGWATLAVVGGALVIAVILLLAAKSRIDHMKRSIRS